MTMPTLMNCQHQSVGWCLDCVGSLEKERHRLEIWKLKTEALEKFGKRSEEAESKDFEVAAKQMTKHVMYQGFGCALIIIALGVAFALVGWCSQGFPGLAK